MIIVIRKVELIYISGLKPHMYNVHICIMYMLGTVFFMKAFVSLEGLVLTSESLPNFFAY